MSNMIETFYYRNYASIKKKIKEYVFIYIGAEHYVVVAYLIQHYFFSTAILRYEVGWFNEEEHNLSVVAARLVTDAADSSLPLLRGFQSFYIT
ncbi:hypothetical protein AHAS_Ahas04G0094900 [Arachis hypogaea]